MLVLTAILVMSSGQCLGDYLQSTLDKIQQERLDTVLQQNQTEHNGEIFFTFHNDDSEEPVSEEPYEPNNFDNMIDQEQLAQYSNMPKKPGKEAPPQQYNPTGQLQIGSDGAKEGEIQGYYYYFYPLNNYLHNMRHQMQMQKPLQGITKMPDDPMKDSDMMNMMMDSMMKNSMMTKSENTITPLFKAISMFIGTALIFIVSILLMPRLRVKKAHGIFRTRELVDATIVPPFLPHSLSLFTSSLQQSGIPKLK